MFNGRNMSCNDLLCEKPRELKAVADLVSGTHKTNFSSRAILNEILLSFKDPDIHNFLFTSEPIQLPYFTNPNFSDSCITATISCSRIDSNAENEDSLSDYVGGSVLYLPAFSVCNTHLGFGFQHCEYSPSSSWNSPTGQTSFKRQARYVMDDKARTFTTVAQAPESDLILIAYKRILTPTCHTRFAAGFHRKRFLSALDKGNTDPENLIPAMFQLQAGSEYRECPYCYGSPKMCHCEIQAARSRHPFDHQSFFRNMALQLGSFQGVANVSLYENGRKTRGTTMGCKVTLNATFDVGLAERLRSWAIGKHVEMEDPLLSRISSVGDSEPYDGELAKADPAEDEATRSGVDGTGVIGSFIDELWKTDTTGSLWPESGEDLNDPLEGVSEENILQMHGADMAKPNNELSQTRANLGYPGNTEWSDNSGQIRRNRSPLPTAPARKRRSRGGRRRSVEDEAVRELKLEMRKERNRASARKSNQKKKAINDALKLELQKGKEKLERLRALELELRQENLQLRKLLAVS